MFRIREPSVAGKLYESNKNSLITQVEGCFHHKFGPGGMKKQKVIGGIVPYNSFVSSGPIAAWVYSKLEKSNYVFLGVSQTPMRSKFSMAKEGLWKTPLGEVSIDSRMAQSILDSTELIEFDTLPFQRDYSIEVQLPFLQYRFGGDFRFVPILSFGQFADDNFLDNCTEIGTAIGKAIKMNGGNWNIIASAKFDVAGTKPKTYNELLRSIVKLNTKKFFDKIRESRTAISGFGSIAVAIAATKKLGAKRCKLLKYVKASKLNPDEESDVNYASFIIY